MKIISETDFDKGAITIQQGRDNLRNGAEINYSYTKQKNFDPYVKMNSNGLQTQVSNLKLQDLQKKTQEKFLVTLGLLRFKYYIRNMKSDRKSLLIGLHQN